MESELINSVVTTVKPGGRAICGGCGGTLIAKCGEINVWHWAHEAADCGFNHEPETDWHRAWKRKFASGRVEVKSGDHRADVITTSGLVIEFQKSSISVEQIMARENHWRYMAWVLDGTDWGSERFNLRHKEQDVFYNNIISYNTFRWKNPRKTWFHSTKPLFIDRGNDEIFWIRKLYRNIPCGGWGYLLEEKEFIKLVNRPRNF